jgi:DNA gyrase/topoisomerase IV subunit A
LKESKPSKIAIQKIVSVAHCVEWEKNPRDVRKDDLQRLIVQIKRLGQYKPLIVFRRDADYVVIGGNMRLRALKKLGIEKVSVNIVKPKNDAQILEFALSDNDRVGFYIEDQLAELAKEFKDVIPMDDYKIDVGQVLKLSEVLGNFSPAEYIDVEEDEIEEHSQRKDDSRKNSSVMDRPLLSKGESDKHNPIPRKDLGHLMKCPKCHFEWVVE